MPQMNKGGKFVFGKSNIQESGKIQFPIQAMSEYQITAEGKVYLFTGSKVTGGFCVTRKGLLLPSKLGHILAALPELRDYTAAEGTFLPYKGRSYCWLSVTADGQVRLTIPMMDFLRVSRDYGSYPSAAATLPSPWAPEGRFWKRRIAIMA